MTIPRYDRRGQLVLVAAAAIVLALFPLVVAYLQLGYAGDVAAEPTEPAPGAEIERALERAVHDAARDVDREEYADSEAAAAAFRRSAREEIYTVETAGIESGRAAEIEYAPDRAAEWVSDERWQEGVAGEFEAPTAHGGVVVQRRAGEYVVVAVAFDVESTAPDRTVRRTVVVEIPG